MPGSSTEPDDLDVAMHPVVEAIRDIVRAYVAGDFGRLLEACGKADAAGREDPSVAGRAMFPALFGESDPLTSRRLIELAKDFAYDVVRTAPGFAHEGNVAAHLRELERRQDALAHDDDAKVAQALDDAGVGPDDTFTVVRAHDGSVPRVLVHDRGAMRPFCLRRGEDPSGVSGTGIIAYGVQFPDGSCVLRWDTAVRSTVFYDSIDDVRTIHGHGGTTEVVWG